MTATTTAAATTATAASLVAKFEAKRTATAITGTTTLGAILATYGKIIDGEEVCVTLTVTAVGLLVTLAAWPALANVGGVAGSVGNVNGGPVAVTRLSATSFAAFSMRCPHAGTTINVVNNGTSFRCPNHGALFNNTGVWQSSPQRADNLVPLTVTYAPGAATLTVT